MPRFHANVTAKCIALDGKILTKISLRELSSKLFIATKNLLDSIRRILIKILLVGLCLDSERILKTEL